MMHKVLLSQDIEVGQDVEVYVPGRGLGERVIGLVIEVITDPWIDGVTSFTVEEHGVGKLHFRFNAIKTPYVYLRKFTKDEPRQR